MTKKRLSKTWGFHVTTRAVPCEARHMPSYLVESYLADSPAAVADARAGARRAAELDTGVRYLRTTFLPGDETVLHMFEAPSADAVRRAVRRAALPYERIVEALESSITEGQI